MRRRIGSLSLPHAISCSSHVRVSSKRVWTCSFMASLSSDFSIFRKPPLAMYRDIQRIENGSTVQKIEYLRYSSFFSSLFSPRLLQYSEISRKRACAYGIPYEGYAIDAGRWERIGMIEKPDGIGYWKAINLRYRDCDRGSQGRGNAIYLFFLLIFNPICTKLFELCCFDR